ncbi:MAG: hypothetical protein QXP20_03235 [Candidatus Bathyarchaeia archaeon]
MKSLPMNLDRITLVSRNYRKEIVEDDVLNALLYGLGLALMDYTFDHGVYASTIVSVGKYLLEYLKRNGVEIRKGKPFECVVNLWKFFVSNGFVKQVTIVRQNDELKFEIHGIFGAKAFHDLVRQRGSEYIRPCPVFATILAQLGALGYFFKCKPLRYDAKNDVWHVAGKIQAMK